MNETINVVPLRHPDEIDDPLTNILRTGARRLLAQAIESEAEVFLAAMKDMKLADGRDRLVRHGHGPTRTIQTGIGPIEVERVKLRDRGTASDGERIRFRSAILPLWARRTKSLRWQPFSSPKVRTRHAPGTVAAVATMCPWHRDCGDRLPTA